EAGVPFFSLSGSEFVEMFVGVGAARVRDLFQQAAAKAPAIIFIDELDAIGKSRNAGMFGGHDEREQTLNQMLAEMDGFDSRTALIVLAATNRPEILDPALMRPGRFDRQVLVDRPDRKGREEILRIHSREVKLGADVDLKLVAARTPGFAGADLANVVNEAALLAARKDRDKVVMADFMEAIERVVAGLEKKTRRMNEKEKEIVAYHESGHALVSSLCAHSEPVHKISIIPRGLAALGYTLQLPLEDRYLMSREELLDKMAGLMGGRAAEEIVVGSISTGASNDFKQATEIARLMVTEYGMSRARNCAGSWPSPARCQWRSKGLGQRRSASTERARKPLEANVFAEDRPIPQGAEGTFHPGHPPRVAHRGGDRRSAPARRPHRCRALAALLFAARRPGGGPGPARQEGGAGGPALFPGRAPGRARIALKRVCNQTALTAGPRALRSLASPFRRETCSRLDAKHFRARRVEIDGADRCSFRRPLPRRFHASPFHPFFRTDRRRFRRRRRAAAGVGLPAPDNRQLHPRRRRAGGSGLAAHHRRNREAGGSDALPGAAGEAAPTGGGEHQLAHQAPPGPGFAADAPGPSAGPAAAAGRGQWWRRGRFPGSDGAFLPLLRAADAERAGAPRAGL